MNFIVLILSSFLLVACQHGPMLNIASSAPARIEKNGILACSSTPCRTSGYFYHDPYDFCVGGADTRLEAFPLNPNDGFRQSKVVSASCDQNVNVFFDMSSGGVVNTIHKSQMSSSGNSIAEKLTFLQNLKKKNLISDEEYKAKKREILDSFK